MKIQERPRFQLGFYRDMGDEDTGGPNGSQTLLQLAPLNLKPSPGPMTTASGSPGPTYAQKMAAFAARHAMNVFSPLAGRSSFGGMGGLGDDSTPTYDASGNPTNDAAMNAVIADDQSQPLSAETAAQQAGYAAGTQNAYGLTPVASPSGSSDLTSSTLKALMPIAGAVGAAGVQIGTTAAYRAAFGTMPPGSVAPKPLVPVASSLSGLLIPALLVGAVFMFAEEGKGGGGGGSSSPAPATNPSRKRKNTKRKAKRKGGKRKKR
jgi:hypothetical protein